MRTQGTYYIRGTEGRKDGMPKTMSLRFSSKRRGTKKNYYLPTPNLFVLLKKKKYVFEFCLCSFESDTVKSDCPMQENYEIFKDLIQTVGLLY